MSSRPRSPLNALHSPPALEAPKESAVSRLLIAPLTFLSFILSLALIDSRNHALRTHTHPAAKRSFFHFLIFKRVPEPSPYAYVKSPDSINGSGSKEGEGEEWYWHTKQRKMMKKEMEDAFRMRKSVMIGVLVLGAGSAVLVGVVLRFLVSGWWRG